MTNRFLPLANRRAQDGFGNTDGGEAEPIGRSPEAAATLAERRLGPSGTPRALSLGAMAAAHATCDMQHAACSAGDITALGGTTLGAKGAKGALPHRALWEEGLAPEAAAAQCGKCGGVEGVAVGCVDRSGTINSQLSAQLSGALFDPAFDRLGGGPASGSSSGRFDGGGVDGGWGVNGRGVNGGGSGVLELGGCARNAPYGVVGVSRVNGNGVDPLHRGVSSCSSLESDRITLPGAAAASLQLPHNEDEMLVRGCWG